MRLGAQAVELAEETRARETYGEPIVHERHRHRYEVNNAYRDALTQAGLVISGTSPDGRLVEYVELPRAVHPFFVATQAHPELKSRPTRPHPLFSAFIQAALTYNDQERLPVELGDQAGELAGVSPIRR
jgi:CTP synthase